MAMTVEEPMQTIIETMPIAGGLIVGAVAGSWAGEQAQILFSQNPHFLNFGEFISLLNNPMLTASQIGMLFAGGLVGTLIGDLAGIGVSNLMDRPPRERKSSLRKLGRRHG